jgi:predicted dehydrogenase
MNVEERARAERGAADQGGGRGHRAVVGTQHARVYAQRPDVDLCAVVGRTPERAATRAGEFGANPYVDLEEMLERERPDQPPLRHPGGHGR